MKSWFSYKHLKLIFILFVPNLMLGQVTCPITTSDVQTCPSTDVRLNASGADYYIWTPSAGLNDSTIANPVANVPSTTTYSVTGYTEDTTNLIKNGDFELGNVDFTSDYKYTDSDLQPEGYYAVGINPQYYHSAFSTCKDHTTGYGNMLIVNGNTVQNSKLWGQTITIEPNKIYAFYAYVTPVTPTNPPIIQFSINGTVLGTPFNSPGVTCTWSKFYAIWYSGSSTTAKISIVNQNIEPNGNDFAIDDIKYVEVCKATNAVTVTVNPLPTVTNTPLTQTICSGTSTTLVTLTSDVASTIFDWTASTGTAIAGFTTNGTNTIPAQTLTNPSNSTAGTVTYVITPKANGCTGTAVNYVVTVNPKLITSDIYHQ